MGGRLHGKVALITGAAMGMGAAEARLFAAEGASVVLADIRDWDGEGVAKSIPGEATFVHLDVRQPADWVRGIALAEERYGRLDILVNNAAIVVLAGVEETTAEEWEEIIATNQMGVWLGMKHAVPALRRAGGGAIVNVSSVLGIVGSGAAAAYQASKGAVRLLSKTAAAQYAPEKIRVNTIFPGIITTPMVEALPPEVREAWAAMPPLQREGRPEEVAYGALYLASDEASYVTGADLVIDGGFTAI